MLSFLDFVGSDPRALVFAAATRNQELTSVVKGKSDAHELVWSIGDETFSLSGKAAVVVSSSLAGRFGSGPRNIALPSNLTSDDFWQTERARLWKELSPSYRASWTWPNSAEKRSTNDVNALSSTLQKSSIRSSVSVLPNSFAVTSLNAIDPSDASLPEDLKMTHLAAFDNFCLLVFRVTKVEHFIYNTKDGIPVRNLYTCARDGQWNVESLNP
ncbi:UNVERIFIED_CONTAM: hypothetical protein HDU68_006454 [Siphonaria sp. JEL0065]|nr:hypothetical protein HDU68_006454 [Siphonaria sp. JEL0065]